MKFIIFHGSFGHPEENWIPWLKKELEKLDQDVITPEFPCEDWDELTKQGKEFEVENQNLNNWLKVFEELDLSFEEELCFIGHSLAPVFILHLVEKYSIPLNAAIFVSPFMEDVKSEWQFYNVNKTFYKTDFDFKKLRNLIKKSYVLYGDNDPYVGDKYPKDFSEKLHAELIPVRKGGHLNESAGFKEFPLLLDLCKKIIK
jgi:predicted alpha/beta hydrolase family esterase